MTLKELERRSSELDDRATKVHGLPASDPRAYTVTIDELRRQYAVRPKTAHGYR